MYVGAMSCARAAGGAIQEGKNDGESVQRQARSPAVAVMSA
ncbi:hypothetical protein L810_8354 [Burkholderia sp. AU4i]|nr:hypothetical protein L810_8354 [Burkholderia sp. AU4i]MDW9233119.1 hypothetical protein [Burkholderia cepacia]QOH36116.1 hypothetical protein C7S14_7621 [Burkholderia cepacia]